jgi:hypothetical protein
MGKLNPKGLPWFPMYTAAWLGSETVQGMTMTERGIYHELMVMCWQYGSIPWDKTRLAKRLRIDPRVVVRFMDNYTNLTTTLHRPSNESPSTLHEPYMEVTLSKLAEFSSTLAKSTPPEKQSRGEESRGRGDESKQQATATTPTPSTPPSQGKAPDKVAPVPAKSKASAAPVDYSVEPRSFESDEDRAAWFRGREEFIAAQRKAKETRSSISAPATSVAAVPEMEDIRDWNEDRFGVNGERLRRCIVYQLDFAKNDWYRKDGINLASMNREKFIAKLNGDTPVGWSPESHGKRVKPVAANHVETEDEKEEREYYERLERIKKERNK